jgi:TatD DNase family protein
VIDFHCHLDLYPNPDRVVSECVNRGVYVLSVTNTPSAWEGTSALAAGTDRILTALGFHPQLAHERYAELSLFDSLLPLTKYVGEIGLDGAPEHRRHWQQQTAVFDHILQACADLGDRCLSIHSRRATTEVLNRLSEYRGAGTFVLHWFSGTLRELDRAVELGCWLSVGPAMLTGKKGQALVKRMPADRLLPESDGPFARVRGNALSPWDTVTVCSELSKLWGMPERQVNGILFDNLGSLV